MSGVESNSEHGVEEAGWDLASGAREVAEVGDRLFLSVARVIGRVGDWAAREADIVGESARAAAVTTIGVSRRMVGLRPKDGGPDASHGESTASFSPFGEVASGRFELLAGAFTPTGVAQREGREGYPPGVTPMLCGLGRLMAAHQSVGYRTLETDEHFWALLELLRTSARERTAEQCSSGALDPDPSPPSRPTEGER